MPDFAGHKLTAMKDAVFRDLSFVQATAQLMPLHNVTFGRCNLHGAVFEGCDLSKVSFLDCNMQRVTFVDCVLSEVDLSKSDLRGCSGLPRFDCGVANLDRAILDLVESGRWQLVERGAVPTYSEALRLRKLDLVRACVANFVMPRMWDDGSDETWHSLYAGVAYHRLHSIVPDFNAPPHEVLAAIKQRLGVKPGQFEAKP